MPYDEEGNQVKQARIAVHVSSACQGAIIGWDCLDCDDPECECECHFERIEPPDEDDGHQEFKDGVAMGYHDRDGNQLDPPEPDWSPR